MLKICIYCFIVHSHGDAAAGLKASDGVLAVPDLQQDVGAGLQDDLQLLSRPGLHLHLQQPGQPPRPAADQTLCMALANMVEHI